MSGVLPRRCFIARALFLALCLPLFSTSSPCHPSQDLLRSAPDRETSQSQIAALAEKLATRLLAANKKKLFVFDLTLPGDLPSPLGEWLADQLAQSLAQAHPELEVIPRSQLALAPPSSEFIHDRNQQFAVDERRARALGAEVFVRGNFAATPDGIGITLMAEDRPSNGNSRFEALAEIPLTPEMQSRLTAALPQRPSLAGAFKASTAGIGSAVCDLCPAPEYTYVAQARKLSGVVIVQVWVSTEGNTENLRVVRTPNAALANAALRAVRNWHFKPASSASGELVPVVVDVAVSFKLNNKQLNASAANKKPSRSY
jgi:periplasmic protein TonB